MRKKLLAVILATAMVAGAFTACSKKEASNTEASADKSESTTAETQAETKASSGGIFGLSVMTLGAEFFTDLQKSTEDIFGAEGYDVKTVSCELDVAKQVSDIENLVTQGAKGILVGPMDPNSLQDACIAARKAGTSIITFVPFQDKEAYDVLIGVDEEKLGKECAQLATEWVDKTFADAKDGSVETILITNPNNETATMRANGLKTITDSKKIKVAQEYSLGSSDTPDRVQEFMEMAISQYPNLKVVICQDSSFAIAANEVLARTAGVDKANIGIFAVGSSQSTLEAVKSSSTNDSMIRGLIDMEDVAQSAITAWKAIQDKTVPEDKFMLGSYSKVNVDNVDEYLK